MGGRVLVAGGQGEQIERLRAALGDRGYVATIWGDVPDEPEPFDVVLAFGGFPLDGGLPLSDRVSARSVVILDAAPDVAKTIAALRAGAADYVTDPEDIDAIDAALHRVIDRQTLEARLSRLH